MKKIKVLFLLLIIILITGCSGTYNLTINKDLKVKEEADFVLENELQNRDKFASLLQNNIDDSDDYELLEEGNNLKISYNHEYDSIEEYLLDSILYKQLFNSISYNADGSEISLEASNIFNLKTGGLDNSNKVNLLQINVNTPLNVSYDNSDSYNENTYTWIIDNKTKEKELNMTFNLNNDGLNIGTTIILLSVVISSVIIIIMVIKRLLEARKI